MPMTGGCPSLAVRKTVCEKLVNVAKRLKAINPDYKLWVGYAFREMKVQQAIFEEILNEFKDQFDDELGLYERIHFGTALDDLTTDLIYYDRDDISEEARTNRRILREAMMAEGFAPYDGEWWHFCYGDKEWAFYYKKDKALYNQVYSFEDLDIE